MESGDPFIYCAHCEIPLPLKLAFGEEGRDWICKRCGAVYNGVIIDGAPPGLIQNLLPAATALDSDERVPGLAGANLATYQSNGSLEKVPLPQLNILCPPENAISRQTDRETLQGDWLKIQVVGRAFSEGLQRKTGR